ncbi:hypothetical protein T05_122 [Trichinella murrelli]|uniref:Uncharacterized protein n=1 Tax=Trichinella murrelli TaxID=144512 RepID=A0A0V0U4G7_9BILA|nr:hypothetical protein T05_122 [Trichinella murrelli]
MESVVVYVCVVFVQFFFDVSFIAPVGWLSATSMTPTIDNVDEIRMSVEKKLCIFAYNRLSGKGEKVENTKPKQS